MSQTRRRVASTDFAGIYVKRCGADVVPDTQFERYPVAIPTLGDENNSSAYGRADADADADASQLH
ncbi:MAG: hypothetical protein M3N95_01340 [Actinomycetota bacterium]|nr:hypothetical protein [Actinomycetota bacterium]